MAQKFPAQTVATFLGQTPLFAKCAASDLLSIAQQADQQTYEAGATMLVAGKPTTALGLLLRGKGAVRLVDAASGTETGIEQVLPGHPYGEVGLLLGGASPVKVVAEEACNVLLFGKPLVESLTSKSPELSLALARRIASCFVQVGLLGARASGPAPMTTPGPAAPAAPTLEEGAIQFVETGRYSITSDLLGLLPTDLLRKHRMLPLEIRDKKLTIGMVNPLSLEALRDLKRMLHGLDPLPVAISTDDFNQTFVRLKLAASDPGATQDPRGRSAPGPTNRVDYSAEITKGSDNAPVIGDEVIQLFDRIIVDAIEAGASDIHIEPESTAVRVRQRVNGALSERKEFVAASYASPLVARIKVLAELDITDRRKPQDGRISAKIGRREINLRVSTMPVARGEKAVIRIIDPGDVMRPLRQIFLDNNLADAARQALADPYGAIIVAGPTGSGKSSTLYSMLNERKVTRPDTNVVTVEDPVEYLLNGVTQVPVLPRAGLTFPAVLRGLMRQDPDAIMIGELRDSETATIMVEAALTGHLVLTSTHGNDSAAVIQRLHHLGCHPFLLSQALSLIIVQRLARRLCPSCAAEQAVAPALAENLASRGIIARGAVTKLPAPVGCDACRKTGYIGRVAVQEMLSMDDQTRIALAAGATPSELIAKAKEGNRFVSFAQSAAHMIARRCLAPADALLIVAG